MLRKFIVWFKKPNQEGFISITVEADVFEVNENGDVIFYEHLMNGNKIAKRAIGRDVWEEIIKAE